MTLFAICFYMLSFVIVVTTVLAITCRNMVHAILFLVGSFIGTAMMFFLLGAPLLAALEIIIYAGGIMVLFLFVIMMLRVTQAHEPKRLVMRSILAGTTGTSYLVFCILLTHLPGGGGARPLPIGVVSPAVFGAFVFTRHWLAIEVISLLLLITLLGVLILGLSKRGQPTVKGEAP